MHSRVLTRLMCFLRYDKVKFPMAILQEEEGVFTGEESFVVNLNCKELCQHPTPDILSLRQTQTRAMGTEKEPLDMAKKENNFFSVCSSCTK